MVNDLCVFLVEGRQGSGYRLGGRIERWGPYLAVIASRNVIAEPLTFGRLGPPGLATTGSDKVSRGARAQAVRDSCQRRSLTRSTLSQLSLGGGGCLSARLLRVRCTRGFDSCGHGSMIRACHFLTTIRI